MFSYVRLLQLLACSLFLVWRSDDMAMQTNIVRQPGEFRYGEDFDLFFRQFCTYAKNVKCDTAAQYDLLLSYLDKKAYRLVEGVVFTDLEKTNISADINVAFSKG